MAAALEMLAEYYRRRNPLRGDFYKALAAEERGLGTPDTLVTTTETQTSETALRQRTYDLLKRVVAPTDEEKRRLEKERGLVFLLMTPQSYRELVAEHPAHYWYDEVNYANGKPALRDFRPPVAVEIGLIEAGLALPGSLARPRETARSYRPRAEALQIIAAYSRDLARGFPGFMAIMLPAAGSASADRAYAETHGGQGLFQDCFAWCLDNFPGGRPAYAGRGSPSDKFLVREWRADRPGYGPVGAVPAVVKIGNK